MEPVEDDIYTIAGRLATFERPHHFAKRRASQTAAKKKAQPTSITWPHANPSPDQLARAGFYYRPSPASYDSVTCFLCDKALDGWDPNDNPALEHLSHVPHCGWAVNACIEQRTQHDMDTTVDEDHPLSDKMLDARRATFRDAWPHQPKKGWKCKLDTMVEAGWCYNPLPEADDCVQCFYCGVSLDGWEPKDDPWEEHQRRAPDCHFFSLVDKAPRPKPASKAKASKAKSIAKTNRISKTSRASTQSNLTQTSDVPSLDLEDSLAAQDQDNDDTVLTVVSNTSSKAGSKGRKRATTTKSRAARSKKHSTLENSVIQGVQGSALESTQLGVSVVEEAAPMDLEVSQPPARKPRATRTKKTSTVKAQSALDGQLDENAPSVDESAISLAPSAAPLAQPKTRAKKQPTRKAEEPSHEDAQEGLPLTDLDEQPAPTRKVSKAKPSQKKHNPEPEEQPATAAEEPPKPRKRGKKRTSEGVEKPDSSVILVSEEPPVDLPQTKPDPPKRDRAASRATKKQAQPEVQPEQPAQEIPDAQHSVVAKEPKVIGKATRSSHHLKSKAELLEQPSGQVSEDHPNQPEHLPLEQPAPPTPHVEPQLPLIASSPQSSDAENQPPSSRPSINAAVEPAEQAPTRIPLKPSTPTTSPSKRNMIAGGLESTAPWTAVDLEAIFLLSPSSRALHNSQDQENMTVETVMQSLTSPEKKMSVEEWILWNAGRAENKLKAECERLIGLFEGEGVRALRSLEGVESIS